MLNIPDNLFRVLIALGAILIGYAYVQYFHEVDDYNKRLDLFRAEEIQINEKIGMLNAKLKGYESLSKHLSERNDIPNPLSHNDSLFFFRGTYSRNGKQNKILDTIYNLFLAYKNEVNLMDIQEKKINTLEKHLDEYHKNLDDSEVTYGLLGGLGILLLLFGLIGMANLYQMENRLKYTEINGQKKFYERCQSCGIKFSSMITYGKNKDETYNSAFCKSCYENGEFTEPQISNDDIIDRISKSGKKPSFAKRTVERLERWKKNRYD